MEPTREDLADMVRSAGLRVTASRVAVLLTLSRHPHADTDTVIRHVRAELGSVSPQAVYNVLAAFVAAGLVRRIEPAGSAALYELRVADNHHHVVCRICQAVEDVDCAVGRRPCLTPSDTHGFLLDEAEVTYWGLCPACQSKTPRDRGAPGGGRPTTRPQPEKTTT
jgi:Fe2+ or Zn2+ uptake regulation protein